MAKIQTEIKVSELEEFQALIDELIKSYKGLPVNVKEALNNLVNCDGAEKHSDNGLFVDPTGHFDLYLKKEGGVIYPCDKNGNMLSNMITGQLNQGANKITDMTVKFYPCGWAD